MAGRGGTMEEAVAALAGAMKNPGQRGMSFTERAYAEDGANREVGTREVMRASHGRMSEEMAAAIANKRGRGAA